MRVPTSRSGCDGAMRVTSESCEMKAKQGRMRGQMLFFEVDLHTLTDVPSIQILSSALVLTRDKRKIKPANLDDFPASGQFVL